MNEDEIILDSDELPESMDDTHESLIIQGSIDALDGNESYAVKYLAGVLISEGQMPTNVYGAESIWESVKGGFNKSITAIKNFFRGIWGFFFGKESDEKDEKENEAIEKDKSVFSKLPSGAELASGAKDAIHSATEKASEMGSKIKAKVLAGIDAAKLYAEDKEIKAKLETALGKLSEIADKAVTSARKQSLGLAAGVALRASLWATYFREFRGTLGSQVKSLAAKTQAEIAKLESAIKSGSESASENLRERLASLKEVMKTYTGIQQLKTSFRSFVTGVIGKLTPSAFKAKEA